ncbi:MAG: 4-(cytidine 5'-diphospho)-2-C-methyl-D-erythritol kinase [Oscillospiraceae bacterium]|nr:4-(cytidine 5'-diphospho)-2-C-methyl-D-erythritol kinase [Oscillospiraceae bacterium]
MNKERLRASAYAKINEFLTVTGRREDGMHTLDTVMQTVSLCDTVEVEKADTLTFTCSEPSLAGEDNLCVKAATAFFAVLETRLAAGLTESASIRLEKKIPTGAGLGGGSADAAAVLRLLNRLYGDPLPEETLFSLGERLGADVPFCLYGGRCFCSGIGEVLDPVPDQKWRALVVAKGQRSLSTAEMYRRLDARGAGLGGPNAFEPVAIELLPEIGELKRALKALGGRKARMTGSGSALFAFFPSMRKAEIAAEALRRERNCFAVACRTVSHEEVAKNFRSGD